jgi:hypothetical protein
MQFELNLSLILAHSLVIESRNEWLPVCDARCGGDAPQQVPVAATNESTAAMLQAFTTYLPGLLQTVNQQLLPSEMAKYQAQAATSPLQANLQADIFGNVAPRLNKVGQDISRSNALSEAQSTADVLAGPGRQVVERGLETSKLADPEFYAVRANAARGLQSLLNSAQGGGLTEGERAQVERATNQENVRSGNLNNTSAINTTANAMNFGNAATAKLHSAIQAATSFLPTSRSGVDVFQQATGRPSTGNQGASQFLGVNQNAGNNAMQLGGQFLGAVGQIAGQQNDIQANRRDSLDRVNQTMSSLPT